MLDRQDLVPVAGLGGDFGVETGGRAQQFTGGGVEVLQSPAAGDDLGIATDGVGLGRGIDDLGGEGAHGGDLFEIGGHGGFGLTGGMLGDEKGDEVEGEEGFHMGLTGGSS